MKKYFIPFILSGMLLAASSASAQHWRRFTDDRYAPRYYYHDRYCDHDDDKKSDDKKKESDAKDKDKDHEFYCYDAWRKDWKADKKAWKADEAYYDDRPYAAERKYYKAQKKAWKSHLKEYDHEHYGYCSHDCDDHCHDK